MQSIRNKLAGKVSKLALSREPEAQHPANLTDYEDRAFCQVEIETIKPNPHQPRKYFDPEALKELAQSIKEKGVLQPVIIRKDASGMIHLVAGERRLRASKMAGLTKIPAILTKDNPAEIAIIENLQRQDLSPIEESEAFGRMVDEYQYTQEKLALVVGKAKSTISELLSLNKLPETIKDEVRRAEHYPRRLLVEIAKQKTPEAMLSLFNQIKAGGLKSEKVREVVRKPQERQLRSPLAVTFDRITSLTKNLRKLDLSGLSGQEKASLKAEIDKLYSYLSKLSL
jgi:ParB family chromosome partitioning protein